VGDAAPSIALKSRDESVETETGLVPRRIGGSAVTSTYSSDSGGLLDVELDLARAAELFRNARIMIVDDDASTVRLLSTVLRMAGATDIHDITDPQQTVARCLEVRPDLLLLDLHMGQVDGHEVLDALHLAIDDSLVVVVLSGDTKANARQRALAAGAKDFIAKPFNLNELVRRIRTVLEQCSLHAR
jgi:PleD family two-component response regulator